MVFLARLLKQDFARKSTPHIKEQLKIIYDATNRGIIEKCKWPMQAFILILILIPSDHECQYKILERISVS